MDIGFKLAGFESAGAFEVDEAVVKTYSRNFKSPIHLQDLRNDSSELSQAISCADILIAGPPCQGFSTAGKNDPEDIRNQHLLRTVELAAKFRPKAVIIENVQGLLSKRNSPLLNFAKSQLEAANYGVFDKLLNSFDFGVPQNRKRLFLLAVQGNPRFEFRLRSEQRKTLFDALLDMPKSNASLRSKLSANSKDLKIAKRIHPGQKLSNVRRGMNSVHTWEIPEVFGEVSKSEVSLLETIVRLRRQNRRRDFGDADSVDVRVIMNLFGDGAHKLLEGLHQKGYLRGDNGYVDITNTFNGKYRRLSWDHAAPTVHTRFGQPRYFLHPSENRGFTYREAARIQTFSDEFVFCGSSTDVFRMIGNAVPPTFAQAIAKFVLEKWSDF